MKIVLQDKETHAFYTSMGRWTTDPEQAMRFPDLPSAVDFVLAFGLHHMRPVLHMAPQQTIELPELEPAPH